MTIDVRQVVAGELVHRVIQNTIAETVEKLKPGDTLREDSEAFVKH